MDFIDRASKQKLGCEKIWFRLGGRYNFKVESVKSEEKLSL